MQGSISSLKCARVPASSSRMRQRSPTTAVAIIAASLLWTRFASVCQQFLQRLIDKFRICGVFVPRREMSIE